MSKRLTLYQRQNILSYIYPESSLVHIEIWDDSGSTTLKSYIPLTNLELMVEQAKARIEKHRLGLNVGKTSATDQFWHDRAVSFGYKDERDMLFKVQGHYEKDENGQPPTQQHTVSEMASWLNCSSQTVIYRMKKRGIARRPRGSKGRIVRDEPSTCNQERECADELL